MGVLTIEIPQKENKSFQLDDPEFSAQILDDLASHAANPYPSNVIPPRRWNFEADLAAVVRIWADRPDSALEIAREIRRRNNGLQ